MIFFIIFLVLLVINCVLWIKNKSIKLISIGSIVFLSSLFVLNTYNTDYLAYYNIYTYNDFNSVEIGYQFLVLLAKFLGLSFFGFKLCIILVVLPILVMCIRKTNVSNHGFLFLYMLISYFIDSVQIRNTIASSFLLIAIIFVFENKKMFAFISLFFAILFHQVFILYLPLLLFNFSNTKIRNRISILSLILLIFTPISLLLGIQKFIPIIFEYLFSVFKVTSFNKLMYFQNEGVHYGALVYIALIYVNLIVVFLITYYLRKNKINVTNIFILKNIEYILYINFYVCLFTPLLLIDINFYRIIRNIFLLNYILLISTIPDLIITIKNNRKSLIILSCVISFFALYKISFVFRGADQTNYIITENILLEEDY